jgi:50S ribosomal protein L16 3-hydroxylase
MLKLPGNLTPENFLDRYWQQQPLLMPAAVDRLRPSLSRNELAWLATQDDVESRLVFVDHLQDRKRYRAETGPFDAAYLAALPKRNWTLLVHDVEKHLPAMRALFKLVPFIPDWRIDDLMVSFAAPGGGVGPHQDNYDVFLCQGIGIRNWRFTEDAIEPDSLASTDLALLKEFAGSQNVDVREGDILYIPPGAAHWGTAKRACMTYSVGMRAPEASALSLRLGTPMPSPDFFYRDPDLCITESAPGFIAPAAILRALSMLELPQAQASEVEIALGCLATEVKDWLEPERACRETAEQILSWLQDGGAIDVHGMSQIAYTDRTLFVNGASTALPVDAKPRIAGICATRRFSASASDPFSRSDCLLWMLQNGAFEIPEIS